MRNWFRRAGPTRQELINRKHQLAGEIRSLTAEVNRRRARSESVDGLERQLTRLRHEHHETRLLIDRTSGDSNGLR